MTERRFVMGRARGKGISYVCWVDVGVWYWIHVCGRTCPHTWYGFCYIIIHIQIIWVAGNNVCMGVFVGRILHGMLYIFGYNETHYSRDVPHLHGHVNTAIPSFRAKQWQFEGLQSLQVAFVIHRMPLLLLLLLFMISINGNGSQTKAWIEFRWMGKIMKNEERRSHSSSI